MNELLKKTLDAHGGLERWNGFSEVSAHLQLGGVLWALKGKEGVLDEVDVIIGLRREYASHRPFGRLGRRSVFTPDRVTIQEIDGTLSPELSNPRASFAGHTLETPWTELQLAYFAGYAMWTYLNTPFLLTNPGVTVEEIEPWSDNGVTWRRLRANFPSHIATHSTVQTLYVRDDGLLARHDYDVEISGGTPGAHFISDYVDASGIKIPTKRRIFPRQPNGQALPEPLVVSIDLSNITLR